MLHKQDVPLNRLQTAMSGSSGGGGVALATRAYQLLRGSPLDPCSQQMMTQTYPKTVGRFLEKNK